MLAVGAMALTMSVGMVPAAASADAPLCAPLPGGQVFVTSACVDPALPLSNAYVDQDTWRTTTDPTTQVTVRYRYVHGGFTGTNARFAFYFPDSRDYQGRFFESTYPTITQEDADPGTIAFAISHGAYVVSTNNDGGVAAAPVLGAYRTNAAAAKYSRVIAKQVYPGASRPRGYIYGASGGSLQTLGALENTSGVWDGGVPMVPPVPDAMPSFFSVQLLALRVLHDKLPQIADAMDAGGSGNPYAGLTKQQSSVLREATLMGFPLRAWWQNATLNSNGFQAVEAGVRAIDPTYNADFWTEPGYEGSEPDVQAARIQDDTTVQSVIGSPATGIVLDSAPAGDLTDADLIITSGPAAGETIPIGSVTGTTLTFGQYASPSTVAQLQPGTTVRLDNSWLVAMQYYGRHAVPNPDSGQYGWNQYRDAAGNPLEPQRSAPVASILTAGASGEIPTGKFHGKMIMLASTMDVQAYPWSADWYRTQASKALGSRFQNSFRLWYMDNADHVPPAESGGINASDHIVAYTGEMQQALLDLDAWVVQGQRPPVSTNYRIVNSQVELPANAQQRHGVQPVVTLTARTRGQSSHGPDPRHAEPAGRIDVAAGQAVVFDARAQAPNQTGKIVSVEWDLQESGTYSATSRIGHPRPSVDARTTYRFDQPGTHFVTVRVTSQRSGDTHTPYGLIQNLARFRVVVH